MSVKQEPGFIDDKLGKNMVPLVDLIHLHHIVWLPFKDLDHKQEFEDDSCSSIRGMVRLFRAKHDPGEGGGGGKMTPKYEDDP